MLYCEPWSLSNHCLFVEAPDSVLCAAWVYHLCVDSFWVAWLIGNAFESSSISELVSASDSVGTADWSIDVAGGIAGSTALLLWSDVSCVVAGCWSLMSTNLVNSLWASPTLLSEVKGSEHDVAAAALLD